MIQLAARRALTAAPTAGGVYAIHAGPRRCLYVGVAKNLRARIESHRLFILAASERNHGAFVRCWPYRGADWISESEAISRFRPKYNRYRPHRHKHYRRTPCI